jgi:copper chaperone CopZ
MDIIEEIKKINQVKDCKYSINNITFAPKLEIELIFGSKINIIFNHSNDVNQVYDVCVMEIENQIKNLYKHRELKLKRIKKK